MKKSALLLALLLAPPPFVRAEERNGGFFPKSDELFHRMVAAPRYAQTLLSFYRQKGKNLADVALGNTWGLVRWGDPSGGWQTQLNFEGMAYSRFRLEGVINEFQTIDFFANVPIEARRGKFSARAMLFHESSHLGDDYIRRTGDTGFRYSVEGFRLTTSYDLHPFVRVYAGAMGVIDGVPGGQKGDFHGGFEVRTRDFDWLPFEGHQCWAYLAEHLILRGRSAWNPSTKTVLGIRIGVPRVVRAMRIQVGYYSGKSPYGQFFTEYEGYWDLAVVFDF